MGQHQKSMARWLISAAINSLAPLSLAAESAIWFNEGMSRSDQLVWYSQTQGSRLIPLTWFQEMIDPKTGLLFSSRENMTRFAYPYLDEDSLLPAGLVVDGDKADKEWLGLTCSACHTGRMTYEGQELWFHGGSSWGNFRELITSLSASVAAMKSDEITLERVASIDGISEDELLAELDQWLQERNEVERILEGTEAWGEGRLDAIAYIFKKADITVATQSPDEVSPANAPVNPPPVWNTDQQAVLQYNGIAKNQPNLGIFAKTELGGYFRNYGEAFGTFSQATYDPENGISSSVSTRGLFMLERAIGDLQSPVWQPEILGEIDVARAEAGAEIYANECADCHALLPSGEIEAKLPIWKPSISEGDPFIIMQPIVDETVTLSAMANGSTPSHELIGTDPMAACNFVMQKSPTGKLEGKRRLNGLDSADFIETYRDEEPTSEILAGLILRDFGEKTKSGEIGAAYVEGEVAAVVEIFTGWFGLGDDKGYTLSAPLKANLNRLETALATCATYAQALHNNPNIAAPFPAYKARPLNGIWASAPYLHNGSVPSLADLLKPTKDRPTNFVFDGVEFDPENIGLVYSISENGEGFRVYDEAGEVILGNWNGGHEYGVSLPEEDRTALLEYLKTL